MTILFTKLSWDSGAQLLRDQTWCLSLSNDTINSKLHINLKYRSFPHELEDKYKSYCYFVQDSDTAHMANGSPQALKV
jgi:hypothetical protein